MRSALVLAVALSLAACTTGNGEDAGSPEAGMDASTDAGGAPDSGPRTCDTAAECDDGFACTIDSCVVGNLCDYQPIDARCGMDERCVVGRGCVTGPATDCTTDVDCDDGDPCNGVETCIVERRLCLAGRPVDCSDGNACTTDICDPAVAGMCRYEPAPGCDAGPMTGGDAGPGCDPFDPSTSYSGMFIMSPSQNCGAGVDMYSVNRITFSVSGGALTAQVGRFTLSQSPAPTGAAFRVTGGDSCASIVLSGTFECEDRFSMGSWSATHTGGCGVCGSISTPDVRGVRL